MEPTQELPTKDGLYWMWALGCLPSMVKVEFEHPNSLNHPVGFVSFLGNDRRPPLTSFRGRFWKGPITFNDHHGT